MKTINRKKKLGIKNIEQVITDYIITLSDEDFESEYKHFIHHKNPLIMKEVRKRKITKLNDKFNN